MKSNSWLDLLKAFGELEQILFRWKSRKNVNKNKRAMLENETQQKRVQFYN